MTAIKNFSRIGAVLPAKLAEEVKAVAAIEGLAYQPQGTPNIVAVRFVDEPSPQVMTQVQNLVTAHDPVDYEEQSKLTDFADLNAMASAGLTQILNDYNENQADITALVAASTFAAAKPILARLLTREARNLTREDKIIRVLRHLVL